MLADRIMLPRLPADDARHKGHSNAQDVLAIALPKPLIAILPAVLRQFREIYRPRVTPDGAMNWAVT